LYPESLAFCGQPLTEDIMGFHFFRRAKRLAETGRELQFYIDTETADNIARGMSPEDARAAARRKLGNLTLIREEVFGMSSITFLENTLNDMRYSLRTMRRSLAFTLTVVTTLAIGIDGNTAIFTILRAVLLKPLAYRTPDRLVYLAVDHPRKDLFDMQFQLSRLEHMREAHSFADLGAFGANLESMTLSGQGEPEALKGARVSANFLKILGVPPLLGRSFLPEEDALNGSPVLMISADLWKRRFNSDPSIVGKAATLDSRSYTIVGVLPPRFEFPFSGLDVWFSKPSEWSVLPPRYWDLSLVHGFGRLKPNVSLQKALAEIEVLDRQYLRGYSGFDPGEMRILWLKDRLVKNVRLMLWMLFGAVGFVLLIACANIAGLLLARSAARSREFALRTAIGAGRVRLIRQLLIENSSGAHRRHIGCTVCRSCLESHQECGGFERLFAERALSARRRRHPTGWNSARIHAGSVFCEPHSLRALPIAPIIAAGPRGRVARDWRRCRPGCVCVPRTPQSEYSRPVGRGPNCVVYCVADWCRASDAERSSA
jgi:hypothetical protein